MQHTLSECPQGICSRSLTSSPGAVNAGVTHSLLCADGPSSARVPEICLSVGHAALPLHPVHLHRSLELFALLKRGPRRCTPRGGEEPDVLSLPPLGRTATSGKPLVAAPPPADEGLSAAGGGPVMTPPGLLLPGGLCPGDQTPDGMTLNAQFHAEVTCVG